MKLPILLLCCILCQTGFAQTIIKLTSPLHRQDDYHVVNISDTNIIKIGHSEDMGVWYGHYYELKMQIPDHEYHIYVDDTLRLTACITNFQKDSIWTTYFPTGEIQSVISYKTGKRNGESLEFYKSGSLLRKGTYVNDCPINGIVTTYYESGGIQAKFYYDHCTYIRQEVYDEHGKIEFIYDPKTGTTITK